MKRYSHEESIVELPGGATMEFVWIEPGTFTRGSPGPETYLDGEAPQHEVTISRGFFLGRYEITQGQWESVMGVTPWSGQEYVQSNPSHPAVYISWNDTQEFIGKLNGAAGEEIYRLPTDAEWEYACRAGTTTRWSFGDDESQLGDYAWNAENTMNAGLKFAQPVGTKLPNPWGLYDMHGNVWEFCQDWYGNYSSDALIDPTGPASGPGRVYRGGDISYSAQEARSTFRDGIMPDSRYANNGARLLRIK
ncbi:MAG: formylglycine-generating enzyme family protein [Gemmatimonadetes bacterium]|nr:formylglycine-generating enzyme family protein [Gemmatimonadota bacterium]